METMTEKEVSTCIEAACRAPSIHNTQPWLFLPVPGGIEVHADVSRRLAAIDPQGRAMCISLGAAVLDLRVAVAALGYQPHVRLLPAPDDRWHVATVTLEGPRSPEVDDVELFAAIPRRRSNRRPFSDIRPPQADLDLLKEAASEEGAMLRYASPAQRDALLSLARTADAHQRGNPAYRAELRVWTTDDPYREDGVPIEAVGPWPEAEAVPIRDFALDRQIPERGKERFERDPIVATIFTTGPDEPAQWLRAGAALQRVLLEATSLGLSASLFTQPLEDPRLRALLDDPTSLITTQAVIRLGYGPPVPATPRRPADEVIVGERPAPLRPLKHSH